MQTPNASCSENRPVPILVVAWVEDVLTVPIFAGHFTSFASPATLLLPCGGKERLRGMEKGTLGFLSPSRSKIIAFVGRGVFWRGFFAGHFPHNSFINKCVCGHMPSWVCWGIITYPLSRHSPPYAACIWQGCSWVSVDKTRWQAAGPLGRCLFCASAKTGQVLPPFSTGPQLSFCVYWLLWSLSRCSLVPPICQRYLYHSSRVSEGLEAEHHGAAAMGMLTEPQKGGLGGQ